jgi:ubiquinone/menaquinone biosynthesis C-methylase UbiE
MTEWDAKAYSERNALQKWLADSHLAQLALDDTERVLDLGCGDGKITAEIARRLTTGSVLGIDPSTRMIAFAQAHFARIEYPNLAFAVGDATRLPYRGEFDLVVSFNALHWVRDQRAALRGIRAALKPSNLEISAENGSRPWPAARRRWRSGSFLVPMLVGSQRDRVWNPPPF